MKKRQKRSLVFLLFGIFFFRQACRIWGTRSGPYAVRTMVCGLRFASFTFSTDAAAFQFVSAACHMPQPVSYSTDMIKCPSVRQKRESSHNLTSKFVPWPEMITAKVCPDHELETTAARASCGE